MGNESKKDLGFIPLGNLSKSARWSIENLHPTMVKTKEEYETEKEKRDMIDKQFKEDKKKTTSIFSRIRQAEEFIKEQPLFYDRAGSFWIWRFELTKWERVDDIDVLNLVESKLDIDTVNSKIKMEILNALKQTGRKNIPEDIKPTWVQFKDKIFDVDTGESFIATPKYFVTNPIEWEVSFNPETPVMDKLFEEWVGKEYVETLHEIISYCMLPDYPIHRLFCFVGSGMNGKSCFLRLLKKFIGQSNVTSTELDTLLKSRFEVTKLYKKLVCQMGETDFNEMSKTSILKKLTGQDMVGFEYKNKDLFDDINYAKIIIATNNLPATTDKTIGFYRRWLILDFPNQFDKEKDILSKIPKEEYNNLASYSIIKLKELLDKREFYKEGNIEERTKKYEDRSNPIEKFIKEFTEEDYDGYVWKFEFEKRLNQWCKENMFRQISDVNIGKKMKELGIEQELRQGDWLKEGDNKRYRAWVNIKWKEGNKLVS